jgi:simple sugar transport system permease protein
LNVSRVPLISILLSLIVGAVIILISSLAIEPPGIDWALPLTAYAALIEGSLGSEKAIVTTLVEAAPLIFTGLAVGVGFKAGLFNIGANGQLLWGGFAAAMAGAAVADQPAFVAIPVAVGAGLLAGAAWGFIPGALKAFTGAHEVVTTIMLNAIAVIVISGMVNDLFKAPGYTFARTADVGNAALPDILVPGLSLGVLLALAALPIVYWLVWRSTIGFEIRTVGANPSAASYAGMSPRRIIIITMSLCGLLAGMAGVLEILGVVGFYPAIFGTNLGFDGITVALLGRAHPVGILLGSLLLGAMRAGAPLMQIQADVPIEIIDVIQAVILFFLAADRMVRMVFRIRAVGAAPEELQTVTRSYGGKAA